MAKENLFNILTHRINFTEIKVLDLFSGTGGISFEFASRGCQDITLVENDYVHFKSIVQNIEKIGLKNEINPVRIDAFKFIKSCDSFYDLVFADPPYHLKELEKLPELIMKSEILKVGSILVLEHSGKYHFNELACFKEVRRYGSVHFSFFEKE